MAGYVFSDIYGSCSKDCGDTTSSFITEIKKKINDVGRSLFQRMDYSWKKRTADLTLVASQSYLNMADVAALWEELSPVIIYYRGSANERVVLEAYDDEEWQDEQDDDEGDPYGYHITKVSGAWRVNFTPVPSANFVSNYNPLKIEYQKMWTELSDPAAVPDLSTSHHQLLLYRTNEIVSIIMGDTESAIAWKAEADKEQGLLNKKQVNRLGRPHKVYPSAHLNARGPRGAGHFRDYNR